MRSDLKVDNLCSDFTVLGRGLTPALITLIRSQADQSDILICKSFNANYFHSMRDLNMNLILQNKIGRLFTHHNSGGVNITAD